MTSEPAEPAEAAAIVEARAGGQLPPAFLAADVDGQAQVAEALAALQLVGKGAQARSEAARLPRGAGEHLEEGHAVDGHRIESAGEGEAR